MRDRQQTLPVRGDQLGRRLRQRVSSRGLHQSDQLQPMDSGEDGASLCRRWVHVPAEMTAVTGTSTASLLFGSSPRIKLATVYIFLVSCPSTKQFIEL